jgi:hypothetical protein
MEGLGVEKQKTHCVDGCSVVRMIADFWIVAMASGKRGSRRYGITERIADLKKLNRYTYKTDKHVRVVAGIQ